jgi:hypothetical protein
VRDNVLRMRAREKRELQMIPLSINCCVQDNRLIAKKVPLLNKCVDSQGCAGRGLIGYHLNDSAYLLDH